MAKSNKSPEKMPPAEMSASVNSGNEPQLQIQESNMGSSVTGSSASNSPTLSPPAELASSDSFGAAVWFSDKRVNGMYTTYHARNSWMSITGIGWVRLATATDSCCEAMTILASHARTKSCRIDYAVDAGLATEIYVW